MAKMVRYNGLSGSYYPCSDPNSLIKGKQYEVVLSRDRGYQTDYTLKGIEGEFNSIWFDDLTDDKKIFTAIGHSIPVINERYICHKIEFANGNPRFIATSTSKVKGKKYLGNNIYEVETQNSTYIVKIG